MTVTGRSRWVLLSYQLPREPSTPRIALWRKLHRLGATQLLDGLVALPLDARNREQLEWLADEVADAGGEAAIWPRSSAGTCCTCSRCRSWSPCSWRSTSGASARTVASPGRCSPAGPGGPCGVGGRWRRGRLEQHVGLACSSRRVGGTRRCSRTGQGGGDWWGCGSAAAVVVGQVVRPLPASPVATTAGRGHPQPQQSEQEQQHPERQADRGGVADRAATLTSVGEQVHADKAARCRCQHQASLPPPTVMLCNHGFSTYTRGPLVAGCCLVTMVSSCATWCGASPAGAGCGEEVAMRWVIPTRPKTDRLACAWLIRRFIDPASELLFTLPQAVLGVAKAQGAWSVDVPEADVAPRGGKCA